MLRELMAEGITIDKVLGRLRPLPRGTAVCGIDEAGDPLLLDLSSESKVDGGILFLTDESGDFRFFAQTFVASLGETVPGVETFVFSRSLESWGQMTGEKIDWRENFVGEFLSQVLSEIKKRQEGENPGYRRNPTIVVFDGLPASLGNSDMKKIERLVEDGPAVGVLPLVNLSQEEVKSGRMRNIWRLCGYYLVGRLEKTPLARKFVDDDFPGQKPWELDGRTFMIRVDGEIRRFRIIGP